MRPSTKELFNKLRAAKDCIEKDRYLPVNPQKAVSIFEDLDLWGQDVIKKALLRTLSEIHPTNYEGPRPPAKSHEDAIKDIEMFGFCWDSEFFGEQMYFKFSIKEDTLYYVSLHQTKFPKR